MIKYSILSYHFYLFSEWMMNLPEIQIGQTYPTKMLLSVMMILWQSWFSNSNGHIFTGHVSTTHGLANKSEFHCTICNRALFQFHAVWFKCFMLRTNAEQMSQKTHFGLYWISNLCNPSLHCMCIKGFNISSQRFLPNFGGFNRNCRENDGSVQWFQVYSKLNKHLVETDRIIQPIRRCLW